MYKKFSYVVATFFGVGYCPKAPGTAGSLATLPFAFALTYFGGFYAMLAFFVLVYLLGTIASKEVLKYTADRDPSFIVIDEVAGQLIPLVFFSALGLHQVAIDYWWLYVALPSFILFRFFDIVKPFPASYFDKKMQNAHGIMLDDIAAGVYTLLAMVLFLVITSHYQIVRQIF
ncbi:MAG: phosphatidylglycerophosphatase A [Fibromonadaceae bacterium]|jgi:phosphatidylglycerophosphatase A|nr:phosphatidylglycerophosphatase A [Fibromonadaceae bacterium]